MQIDKDVELQKTEVDALVEIKNINKKYFQNDSNSH